MNPFVLVPAIAAIAIGYVMLPVGLAVFSRYRRRKLVRCPEMGSAAQVRVDAHRAGLAAAFGRPIRVAACLLWPEKQGCGQECLDLPVSATRDVPESHVAA